MDVHRSHALLRRATDSWRGTLAAGVTLTTIGPVSLRAREAIPGTSTEIGPRSRLSYGTLRPRGAWSGSRSTEPRASSLSQRRSPFPGGKHHQGADHDRGLPPDRPRDAALDDPACATRIAPPGAASLAASTRPRADPGRPHLSDDRGQRQHRHEPRARPDWSRGRQCHDAIARDDQVRPRQEDVGILPKPGDPENWATPRDFARAIHAIVANEAAAPESCVQMLATLENRGESAHQPLRAGRTRNSVGNQARRLAGGHQ